jgi:eukaryotic-like serine/threonine-protein kinase
VLGTPAYMAPEQLQGEKLGPAVDIYALAAMTFEMLTGRKARRGRTAVEIAHQVVNQPAPDPRDANPAIPAAAAEAIQAGMARDPAERPRSAVELAARLEQSFSRGATRRMERARAVAAAPPPPQTPRTPRLAIDRPDRSGRWLPAALVLLALAAVAVIIALSSGGDDGAPERAADSGRERGGGQRQAEQQPQAAEEEPAAPAVEEPAEESGPFEVPKPSGAGGSALAEQLHLDGHAALEAGDYDSAIELNTRAIETFPEGTTWQDDMNYAYALYSLGRALRLAGRPEEAIPVLEQRLQVPNQTETVQGELDQARAAAGG